MMCFFENWRNRRGIRSRGLLRDRQIHTSPHSHFGFEHPSFLETNRKNGKSTIQMLRSLSAVAKRIGF